LIVLKMLSAFACIASMSSRRVSAAAAIVAATVVGVVTRRSAWGSRLRALLGTTRRRVNVNGPLYYVGQ
jgi:hypothetical protein